MADGGSFSDDVDGGTMVAATPDLFLDLNFNLTSSYLFETGNLAHILHSGNGADALTKTGVVSKIYKLTASSVDNEPDSLENEQLFSIVPSNDYKIYEKNNQVIYTTAKNRYITITGLTANSGAKMVTVDSFVNPVGQLPQVANARLYTDVSPIATSYDITPSQNLLYVYNLSSQESIDIKNYYFQMRTGITGANILGINCDVGFSGDMTNWDRYTNEIREPIHRYIVTGGRPIKYVCLLHGIPSYITGSTIVPPHLAAAVSTTYDLSISLDYMSGYARSPDYEYPYSRSSLLDISASHNIDNPFMFQEYSGQTALFCQLSTLPTQTANLSGYIRRICEAGVVDGPFLKGSGQNDVFLVYSNQGENFLLNNNGATIPNPNIEFYNDLGVNVFTSKPIAYAPVAAMTGGNVGGFTSDGSHGNPYLGGTGTTRESTQELGAKWATNNGGTNAYFAGNKLCIFEGYNWYITSHYESYAGNFVLNRGGDYITGSAENFSFVPFPQMIKSNAMGGTDYNNIPVGYVGSIVEPFYDGIESILFFDAWFKGRPFIECAYMGLNKKPYSIQGDPLVKWR